MLGFLRISTLPSSALLTGQPSCACSTALWKSSASMPGTLPRISRSTLATLTLSTSNVHTALISSRSGGVPPSARTLESAIAKHAPWAAAMSSSGLVLPSERSVREAQVMGISSIAPLPTENLPPPRSRSPSQTISARRSASATNSSYLPLHHKHHATHWSLAHLKRLYSLKCLEGEFSDVRIHGPAWSRSDRGLEVPHGVGEHRGGSNPLRHRIKVQDAGCAARSSRLSPPSVPQRRAHALGPSRAPPRRCRSHSPAPRRRWSMRRRARPRSTFRRT